uniref:Uncharacterized protein n=1 Tax=viral metagenome TaxID=1070528 RepID=A0A6C0DZP2_9ZZZZ
MDAIFETILFIIIYYNLQYNLKIHFFYKE